MAFQDSSQYNGHNVNSIPITLPSVNANDLLIVLLSRSGATGSPTVSPSGWTQIGSSRDVNSLDYTSVWIKVAVTSEPNPTWQFSALCKSQGTLRVERGGFSLSNPIQTYADSIYGTSDTIMIAGQVTVTHYNSPIIIMASSYYSSSEVHYTPSSSPQQFTEDFDNGNAAPDLWAMTHSMIWSEIGNTGDISIEMSASNGNKQAFVLVLNPSPYSADVHSGSYTLSGNNATYKSLKVTEQGDYLISGTSIGDKLTRSLSTGLYSISGKSLLNRINKRELILGYNPLDTYNLLNENFEPNEWPQGGPYAEQLIDSSKLKKLKTPSGIYNLLQEITINNKSEKCNIRFEDKTYIEDGFETITSDVRFLTGQKSEFPDDTSIIFNSDSDNESDYVRRKSNNIIRNDIVFEFVFKPLNYDFNCNNILSIGNGTSNSIFIYRDNNKNIVIKYYNGSDIFTITTTGDNINDGSFYHIAILIGGRDNLESEDTYYYVYINGELNISGTFVYNNNIDITDNSYIKIGENSSYCISVINYWYRYKWFSNNVDEISNIIYSRYENYKNGNLDVYADIPISIYTWGDGNGTIPLVCIKDINNVWHLLFDGTTDKNYRETTIRGGVTGIRLFSKYEIGYSNFDDISTASNRIEAIQIPRKYERIIKRVILQSKPNKTWCILVIEWI